MMMMLFDPLYMMLWLPGVVLATLASVYTKSMFSRYSRVGASSGLSGAEAARQLLRGAGIYDVAVEHVGGFLSDHYDPSGRVLRLSDDVYAGRSLAAIGVACHEAGHAIQHAEKYAPLGLRSALVPAAALGSNLAFPLLLLGLVLRWQGLVLVGVGAFALAVLFTLVTLPVEYNASARAKKLMVSAGIVSPSEAADAGAVLNAAFMTYVASAVSAMLMLLYFLIRAGLLGGSRRD